MTAAAWSFVKLAGLSVLLAEAAARLGGGSLGFWDRRPRGPLGRFGLGYLLGLGLAGPALLGLALTGLYAPALIAALLALLLAGSRAAWRRESVVLGAWRALRGRLPPEGAAVLALAAAPGLYALLVPEGEQDAFIYHLGLPWQWLEARRAVLTWVPAAFHLSLPVDLGFTVPLLLGDDRLAKWMIWWHFWAATAVFLGVWRERAPERAPGSWLGTALVLTTGQSIGTVMVLMTRSKNDVAAAAFFVAGALLARKRAWTLGAVLLGMAVAAKQVYGPAAALLLLLDPPRARAGKLAGLAACAALWLLPWWGKTWLATGNPLYPLGAKLFHSYDWDERNVAAFRTYFLGLWSPDTLRAKDLPGAWLTHMKKEHLAILLLLPGLFLLGRPRAARAARAGWTRWAPDRHRLVILAIGAAQVVTLGTGHYPRYLLPTVWYLALLAGEEFERLPPRAGRVLAGALAAAALSRFALSGEVRGLTWREALHPRAELDRRWLSTYGETVAAAAVESPRRLLLVGEMRTYLFPGRVLYGGSLGETSLVWKLVRESGDDHRLAAKFRQLGAPLLVYNFVSADWVSNRYVSYPWDARMLGLYRRYARGHFELAGQTRTLDYVNGGFCRYRVRPRARVPLPPHVWFLPGTEPVWATAIIHENARKVPELIAAVTEVLKAMPDVGHAWNQMGHAYAMQGDSRKSFDALYPFSSQGMVDLLNVPELGGAALRVGRLDLAEQLLQTALTTNPDQTGTVRVNLAQVRSQRAFDLLGKGKFKEADALLAQADELIALVAAASPNKALNESRRLTLATLWAMKGEVGLAANDGARAVTCFREALRIAPESSMAARWQQVIDRLVPRTLEFGRGR